VAPDRHAPRAREGEALVIGAVIGEAPGRTDSALSPYAPNSAAARLTAMADVAPCVFEMLQRRNLFARTPSSWRQPEAVDAAWRALGWLRTIGADRVLLLGARVAQAFERALVPQIIGCLPVWSSTSLFDIAHGERRILHIRVIPHPSGRNRVYNAPDARRDAASAVRWALGLEDSPATLMTYVNQGD